MYKYYVQLYILYIVHRNTFISSKNPYTFKHKLQNDSKLHICVAVRQNYRNKYTKQNINIKQPVRAPETCLIIHLFCDLAELLCRSTVRNLHLHVSFRKFVELVEGANCMGISLEQRLCQIKCIQLSIVTTIHYHP